MITHMNLPRILHKTLLVCLLLTGAMAIAAPSPNVVLILIDDYGYGDISFEGNTQVSTPNIDRIAKEGIHLNRFYQSAGACAPTRASLLTGRDYPRTGVWGVHWGRDFIRQDEKTLGDLFQHNGYRTGVFGKWHSGKTWSYFGWSRGFDTSVHTRLYMYWDTMVISDNRVVYVDGPMTDVVGDRAVAFIEENRREPFFCYIPFQAMHEPYNCPDDVFAKYKALGYTNHVARLYGMIEVMDDNIGKVLDTLDKHDLEDDTVVIFMVDDGYSPGFDLSYQGRRMNDVEKAERMRGFGRQLRGSKATIWEGGQITPCYIRWPGKITAGTSSELLSNVSDIYPTLADLGDLELPKGQLPLDGRSMWPALKGESEGWPERIIFDATNFYLLEYDNTTDGPPRIRELSAHYKQFKYIRKDDYMYGDKDADVVELLYNLKTDPLEQQDISGKRPGMVKRLRAATMDWFSGILESGRAYQEAIYPVGNISEGGTPINLDSRTRVLGTAKRSGPPGFVFGNWTEPGSGLEFDIDVVEAGQYQVELIYKADANQRGGRFRISADGSQTEATISASSSSLSKPFYLKKGRQNLTVELLSTGKTDAAIDTLQLLVVHRVADRSHNQLVNAGLKLRSRSNPDNKLILRPSGPSWDFMQGTFNDAVEMTVGDQLVLEPIAENEDDMTTVTAYLGFDAVVAQVPAGKTIYIPITKPGKHTLNVVLTDKPGNTYTFRRELDCRNPVDKSIN